MTIRHHYRKLQEDITSFPITCNKKALINKKSKIMGIGSCFAIELQKYLIKNKYNVITEEFVNTSSECCLIWYNTYTIRYEFDRIINEFDQGPKDIWKLSNGKYQDPYRRCVFANSKQELWDRINYINKKMKQYILSADVIVLTLGLTEVFFQKNGKAICAVPGYPKGIGGGQGCDFRILDYNENYNNISRSIDILNSVNKNCKIILSTSPVPLGKTFSEKDHLIANTDSKSILRAVAGEIDRKYGNVHYFHSYEMALNYPRGKVFKNDGRHVNEGFVKRIMGQFEKYYIKKEI